MARLTASDRRNLPKSDYAVPSRKPDSGSYPIPDRSHAKAALSMVSRYGDAAEKAAVRKKVASKYGMGPGASGKEKKGKSTKDTEPDEDDM